MSKKQIGISDYIELSIDELFEESCNRMGALLGWDGYDEKKPEDVPDAALAVLVEQTVQRTLEDVTKHLKECCYFDREELEFEDDQLQKMLMLSDEEFLPIKLLRNRKEYYPEDEKPSSDEIRTAVECFLEICPKKGENPVKHLLLEEEDK